MKKVFSTLLLALTVLTSCGDFNSVLKSTDLDYRYEAAKQYYFEGNYENTSILLNDLLATSKGTDRAEETLYLLGMVAFKDKHYSEAASYFKKYAETYPYGKYTEDAEFNSGWALSLNTPVPILDQSDTYTAINELNQFLEKYPKSKFRKEATRIIFAMQDKIIEKEYNAAKLYYDLGTYFGNCSNGGSNYQACIITAQNAINDYPYATRREDFAILLLKAKFDLAAQSVEYKQKERYQSAINEYYGFANEYPNSAFLPKAKSLYEKAKAFVKE